MSDLSKNDLLFFKDFDRYKFEDWLRIGLENYLLKDKKSQSFSGTAVEITRYDYPAEALDAIYQNLPPAQQSSMRLAVASLINSWEINEDNFLVWEHLLQLASLLPAREVLRGFSGWMRLNYLNDLPEQLSKKLFDNIIMTINRLIAPSPESVQCLRELITFDKLFRAEWSGMILEALWICDSVNNAAKHFERLRPYLSKLMDAKTDRSQIWACRILNAVGLYKIVQVLSLLQILGEDNDTWFLEGLLSGSQSLIECWEGEGNKLYFRLKDQPDTEETLLIDEFSDLLFYLKAKCLIKAKPEKNFNATVSEFLESLGDNGISIQKILL